MYFAPVLVEDPVCVLNAVGNSHQLSCDAQNSSFTMILILAGVAVVYWKPPGFEDSPEEVMGTLLDAAAKTGIKIALHINPYYNWSIENLLSHLMKILTDYGNHRAFYKIRRKNRDLPVSIPIISMIRNK